MSMATDPDSGCPRCSIPYKRADCPNLVCPNCNFLKILDTTSRQKYQMKFWTGAILYTVSWYRGDRDFSFLTVDELDRIDILQSPMLQSPQHITFDHWLPFDITLEQLKLYLTFS